MFRHCKVFITKLKNLSFQGSWRSRGSSAGERALQYTVGQKIHGFTVKEVTAVPDLFLTSVKLSHDATGAQYLHAARDDSNNLFSVQFRTTPMDSTGVTHILEHTVLCGSQRFPCRDPFFKMLNRSLSTFMNTSRTFYSVINSTSIGCEKDMLFFFRQEGWRLEHKTPTDPSSRLMFKGVVFNEMKGEFSLLLLLHVLFVNARYTHKTLRLFPSQTHWDKPRVDHVTCRPDALAPDPMKQNTLCMSYLLGDITDTFETFTLSLLSSLMISGPNSPFYKALIEPEIGSDFSSSVGFDGSTRQASFTIGLQGMAEADTETVKHIIAQSIDDIIATGFEEEQIEALLHKIEIQMKHQSTSFGLALASYIASCWNHDGDPVQLLKISENVSRFRQCLKENPRYLQDKVQHYFKDNTHRLTLTMSPDERFLEKQAEAEEQKLQQKIQNLSDADHKDIYEKGLQLLAVQSTTQDASCLPALKVSDIEPIIPYTPVQLGTAGGVPVQCCEQPTNGMVYFRAMCNLNSLPEDLKIYVPLFCSVITKLGCGELDYRQQAQRIELKTGGMSVSPQIIPDTDDLDLYEQGIILSSSCLDRNLPDMFQLWSDIFNRLTDAESSVYIFSPHFDDEQHLRVLVMMSSQELSNGISYSGHMYAMTRAARTLVPTADLQETFGGMDQVKFMKSIAEMTDLTSVLRKLPWIKRHLLNPENMRCAVNATPQKMSDAAGEVERFMGNIAANRKERKPVRPTVVERALDPQAASSEPHFKPCQMKTYFQLPFNVNFVSECVRTVPFSHADYASLCILARMMTAKFLHGEIREKGGAYGGGARMGGGGLFSFYSYRDPNSTQTLSAFRGGVEWARAGKFTQQDINEAKLSVFSAVDAPVAPSDKGLGCFLNGITDELKQRYRERLFAVTDKNLIDVAGRYLGVGQQTCGVAILGPENESIRKDPSWVVK
uniref:Pitrilysin metalloproteinase 1 n=1 Tax=Sinocyclocheilus anshuiensis TaxID=1608454 RepID=A0A671NIE0_9TELE